MTHPWELTADEAYDVVEAAFKADPQMEHYVRARGHWENIVPILCHAAQVKLRTWQRAPCQDHDMGPSLSGQPYHLPHGECPFCRAALDQALK